MQIGTLEVVPCSLEITQIARQDLETPEILYRSFPYESHISIGIAIEKGERLDHDWNGGVQLCASSTQQVPLLAGLRVERISPQRQGDPGSAVNENRLALAHQGSS